MQAVPVVAQRVRQGASNVMPLERDGVDPCCTCTACNRMSASKRMVHQLAFELAAHCVAILASCKEPLRLTHANMMAPCKAALAGGPLFRCDRNGSGALPADLGTARRSERLDAVPGVPASEVWRVAPLFPAAGGQSRQRDQSSGRRRKGPVLGGGAALTH